MRAQNIACSQIFTVAAASFTAGIFVQVAVEQLGRGNIWLSLLDVAAVAVNAAVSIALANKLYRAMPASAGSI